MDNRLESKTAARGPRIAIIGCGAVAELYHGPALEVLEAAGLARVTTVVDRSEARTTVLQGRFPTAKAFAEIRDASDYDFALVATPPSQHAKDVQFLMSKGAGVLCEKPIATGMEDAKALVDAVNEVQGFCSIGQFRRWFPAVRAVRELIEKRSFGELRDVRAFEGGPFKWPVTSGAIFDRSASGGGVMMDIGIHAVDLFRLWLGEPDHSSYEDDACGGVEINAVAAFTYPGGSRAELRLSWDWGRPNVYEFDFDGAVLRWNPSSATRLDLQPRGMSGWFVSELHAKGPSDQYPIGTPATSYLGAFTNQWIDVLAAYASKAPPPVSAEDARRSLDLVLGCYRVRSQIAMPWAEVAGVRDGA